MFFLLISIIFLFPHTFISATIYNWKNWAKNQSCSPTHIFYPNTLHDIKKIIADANTHKIPVRFVGSGHSWSDLVTTQGYLVCTDTFNKVLYLDKQKGIVKVEGGIKIKNLIQLLAHHGLALSNQGFITEQSIAGATATATHGSGKTGTLSDFIIGIELVDAMGNLHIINKNSHANWLPAARVNLGALGFIYSITLQCEPLFILRHKQTSISWNNMITHYNEYFLNNDYCMFMGPLDHDHILMYTWNKTHKQPTSNFFTVLLEKIVMSNHIHTIGRQTSNYLPKFTNKLLKYFFDILEQKEYREYSYITLSPFKNPISVEHYREAEYSIPMDQFPHALSEIKNLYLHYLKKGETLVAVLAIRFGLHQDLAYLDPSYGRNSIYFCVNTINISPNIDSFYKEVNEIMLGHEGRPHWGKINFLNKQLLMQLYGTNFDLFNAIRSQLDPHNIFANSFIQRCFC